MSGKIMVCPVDVVNRASKEQCLYYLEDGLCDVSKEPCDAVAHIPEPEYDRVVKQRDNLETQAMELSCKYGQALSQMKDERDEALKALAGLVGADDQSTLERMEATIRLLPMAEQDRANTLNAIHVLLRAAKTEKKNVQETEVPR